MSRAKRQGNRALDFEKESFGKRKSCMDSRENEAQTSKGDEYHAGITLK